MTEQLTLFEVPVSVNDATDTGLVAQERAARVTARLYSRGYISLSEAQEMTGLTYSGVWYLMSKVCRVLPVWYDRAAQMWIRDAEG